MWSGGSSYASCEQNCYLFVCVLNLTIYILKQSSVN